MTLLWSNFWYSWLYSCFVYDSFGLGLLRMGRFLFYRMSTHIYFILMWTMDNTKRRLYYTQSCAMPGVASISYVKRDSASGNRKVESPGYPICREPNPPCRASIEPGNAITCHNRVFHHMITYHWMTYHRMRLDNWMCAARSTPRMANQTNENRP